MHVTSDQLLTKFRIHALCTTEHSFTNRDNDVLSLPSFLLFSLFLSSFLFFFIYILQVFRWILRWKIGKSRQGKTAGDDARCTGCFVEFVKLTSARSGKGCSRFPHFSTPASRLTYCRRLRCTIFYLATTVFPGARDTQCTRATKGKKTSSVQARTCFLRSSK